MVSLINIYYKMKLPEIKEEAKKRNIPFSHKNKGDILDLIINNEEKKLKEKDIYLEDISGLNKLLILSFRSRYLDERLEQKDFHNIIVSNGLHWKSMTTNDYDYLMNKKIFKVTNKKGYDEKNRTYWEYSLTPLGFVILSLLIIKGETIEKAKRQHFKEQPY